MRNVWPVFKRETRFFFTSPIAYAVIFMFLLITGFLFTFLVVFPYVQSSYMAARNPMMEGLNFIDQLLTPSFGQISMMLLFMLPVLTMRLFAEEKKSGTYELLMSYPVRDIEILLGKYLAAMAVVLVMLALSSVYYLVLRFVGVSEPGVVFSGYLGVLLEAASFVSLGLFLSSLTENQIVAAVLGFGALLLVWVIHMAAINLGPPWKGILAHISLVMPIQDFARGVIDTKNIVYYLSFIFFFLFLTLRSLESNRWRG